MKVAQRIQTLPVYRFAELERKIHLAEAEGHAVIHLERGSPDLPPDPKVVAALTRAAGRADAHGYPAYAGLTAFRQAIATYYTRRFGVTLDPATEVLPLLGAKEGAYYAAQAFINPGDVALTPDPAFPTYRRVTLLAGGEAYPLPLLRENHFRPDFAAIPADILSRARLLWLNYPNNPTTALADLDFFTDAVALARRHDLLLVHDNPYADVNWIGLDAPSVLQVPGAKDVALELNSLSKLANMAGWRVGMAVGNASAVGALAQLKVSVDSGIFLPLQEAAIVALNLPAEWIADRNSIYKRRRDLVTRALDRMRLWYAPYAATPYVWAEIPPQFADSLTFAETLLAETDVALTPGPIFGAHGEGFVRIALVQPEDRLEAAMERWERWLISRASGIALDYQEMLPHARL